jgi:hypothetical protein
MYIVVEDVINYMVNRLNTYPMQKNDKKTETI